MVFLYQFAMHQEAWRIIGGVLHNKNMDWQIQQAKRKWSRVRERHEFGIEVYRSMFSGLLKTPTGKPEAR